ncbi:MAG TPA: sigma-70 family RNA polymerase sigma factor [Bryobacteraceae bacterium]|jgi:RNA polymerase sigma-70 factor (ECF subfamily)
MNRQEATQLLTDLFDTWYPSLLRYAYRLTGHMEQAEDVVQETFLALYRELTRGGRIDNAKGWTLIVVRREVLRRARHHRLEGIQVSLEDAESSPAMSTDPKLAEFLFGDVARLFGVLSAREEEVLLLRIESLKYREIGDLLGISSNSVTTLLSRAIRKLRLAAAPFTKREQEVAHAPKTLL